MRRALAAALLLALPLPLAAEAEPCGLRPADAAAGAPVPLAELPEGIVRGLGVCDGLERPMAVWTLAVDAASQDLGIRDRPLLHSVPANPLVPVTEAEVAPAGRLSIFRRDRSPLRPAGEPADAPDRRAPYRLFGTFCDPPAAEPLDCSAGAARIKMRADVVDADLDGALDRVRHEVSIWDGADRLQVLMFETDHAGRPLGNAVPWIEALTLAGQL